MNDFNIFNSLFDKIIGLLPKSPFTGVIDGMESDNVREILGYLNWFVPVHDIVIILSGWLSCIALYYLYVIILRWIRAIN